MYTLSFFVLGIKIALRISGLLKLKWVNVLKNKKRFKDICIIEGETNKERRIKLNKTSKNDLKELLDYSMDHYIFKSREGNMLFQSGIDTFYKLLNSYFLFWLY
ncbi:tyrosine-type recombinase/integrase [Senegalia massiliensis]|uniref:Tyr recombinase domain-containing protein n=1 Tax=Senegalia massiliensis TaxID=1720316 RepID=A0A845QY97_9CLOT|nr:hypothetical protein [Senegalia massiliensis]